METSLENVYFKIQDSLPREILKQLSQRKNEIITQKLKERTRLSIDIEEESKRRFKRLVIEVQGDKETVYYNDGSINGIRIVTFESNCISGKISSKGKIYFECKYY